MFIFFNFKYIFVEPLSCIALTYYIYIINIYWWIILFLALIMIAVAGCSHYLYKEPAEEGNA